MVEKVYVVFNGRKPGIYETWEEAKIQVHRFPNARHKSFKSREEAEKAFTTDWELYVNMEQGASSSSCTSSTFKASKDGEKTELGLQLQRACRERDQAFEESFQACQERDQVRIIAEALVQLVRDFKDLGKSKG